MSPCCADRLQGIETANGVTGIGKTPSHILAAIITGWSGRLAGPDPPDIAGLERRVLPSIPFAHSLTDHATRGPGPRGVALPRIDSNQAFSLPSCVYLAPAFEECAGQAPRSRCAGTHAADADGVTLESCTCRDGR